MGLSGDVRSDPSMLCPEATVQNTVLTGRQKQAFALGERLRPIVLGAPSAELASVGGATGAPDVVVSVHSSSGDVLGYAVVDHAVPGATRGGLTVSPELSLTDAVVRARARTLQLRLCGLPGGAHHCVFTHASAGTSRTAARRAFLDGLAPLAAAGLCDVVFTEDERGARPPLAHGSLVASVTATALSVLEHLAVEPAQATFVLRDPSPAARETALALAELGARELGGPDGTGAEDIDLALVDGPPRPVRLGDPLLVRARAIVLMTTSVPTAAAEAVLDDRGVIVVPETLATAGRTVALDLLERGLDKRSALLRSTARVRRLTTSLLLIAHERREPLMAIVRAAAE